MDNFLGIVGPLALIIWLFILVIGIMAFLMPFFVYQIRNTVKRQEEIIIKMEDHIKKLYLILGSKR